MRYHGNDTNFVQGEYHIGSFRGYGARMDDKYIATSPLNFHFNPFFTIQTERHCALNEESQICGMQPGMMMTSSS